MLAGLFPTRGSTKRLRAYYRERLTVINFDELLLRLHQESDRAKIILLSSILDDLLEYRLSKRIKPSINTEQTDYLFRFEGPLGTFSSRIELGYAFGFIEPDIASQLNTIREMRNACAHSKFVLSFDNEELRNVAKHMFKPSGLFYPLTDDAAGFRQAFLAEMPPMFFTLTYGSRRKAIALLRRKHLSRNLDLVS